MDPPTPGFGGESVRSYVLQPYQLVKDARTGYEMGNIQAVLDGELDPFIREYLLGAGSREDRLDRELHFPEPSQPGASASTPNATLCRKCK